MQRPRITDAPGIAWRKRADGWAALWVARADLLKRGFRESLPSSVQIHLLRTAPNDDAVKFIRSECLRLQDEMLAWARGGDQAIAGNIFDGTIRGLSRCFQNDPDSPFRTIRGRRTYLSHLTAIEATVGDRALHALGARDFLRWNEAWSDGGKHVPRAHARMSMVRRLMSFGVTFELYKGQPVDHCLRLKTILAHMEFANAPARSESLTLEHCIAIRAKAHEIGEHEIALAQVIQFELGPRQKDVIGEWLPIADPGTSDIIARGKKWLLGMRWEEVGADLWLTHRLSKSLHGKAALADPSAGRTKRWNLALYPGILEEIARLPARPLSGPMIVDHKTGLPFANGNIFRDRWRVVAQAAGVPPHVQNRDSRAGRVTEAIKATGGNVEAVRKTIGHAQAATTQIYNRDDANAEAEVQAAVLEFRRKQPPR